MHRRIYVGLVATERIEHGLRYRGNCRFVKNVVNTTASVVDRIQIEQVGLAKINSADDFRDVVALSSTEVVDSTDIVALRQQPARYG